MAVFSIRDVARLSREEGPFDLIDAHYVYPDGYAAMMIAKRLGLPVVVSGRGTDVNLYPSLRSARRRIEATLRGSNCVIAVSRSLGERMLSLGASRERCWIIPNGVDLERFAPPTNAGPRAGRRRILAVGNLVWEKGFDLLIEAFADVLQTVADIELAVIGEGPQRGELEERIANSGIGSRACLLGAVPHEELDVHFRRADLLCLASRREGCPNVVLEALASGVPVVANPVGGVPELVRDGVNGILTAETSSVALAEGIRRALRMTWSPALVRSTVADRSWTSVADRLQEVFLGISEGTKRFLGSG